MSGEEPEEFEVGRHSANRSDKARTTGADAAGPAAGDNPQDESFSEAGSSAAPDTARSGPDASISGDARDEIGATDVDRLGPHLARSLLDGSYHPVVLFGTTYSGKTSLLLSLLSTLISEPRLKTGLVLCDPILASGTSIGRHLHEEARKLFEVKTQAFIQGEKIPATTLPLPFFVPVEIRPQDGPWARFAFMESNGEWYRPLSEAGSLASAERLYPQLRTEIEEFIASFQGGITFIYLIPYTQREVYADRDGTTDASQVQNASIAITGVIRAYDRMRANQRANDRHLMLVTKWDAHTARQVDRVEGIQEDREALNDFVSRKYSQAIAAFQGMDLRPGQRQLNAYCSGIINDKGLLQLKHDDDVRDVVMSYPIRLWGWLYKNALQASEQAEVPLFPGPPRQAAPLRAWRRLLDFVSGR